jgi:GT2 family glycosyltransferase
MRASGRVSAVMVTYQTGPALFGAIEAVLGQAGLDELVLVDNGNPEPVVATLNRLEAAEDRVRLLTGHGNVGYAAACNLGAGAARGDYLLFVNPDCLLPAGAVAQFLAVARRTQRPAVLGCRLSNPDGTEQRGSRRAALTPWTALVETLRLDRLAPHDPRFARLNQHDGPAPEDVAEVPVVSGACLFTAVGDFRALDGFDEGYFLHVDDIDFCFRMRKAGGHVVFLPQVRPVHYRSTSRAHPIFVEWCKTRGFLRYFRKNFSDSHSRFVILLTNLAVCLRFVVRAAWLTLRGVLRRATPGDSQGRVQGRAQRRVLGTSGAPGDGVSGKDLAGPNSTTGRPA